MKFQWKNRRKYIQRTAFYMLIQFEKTQNFLNGRNKTSLDVIGCLDKFLDEYSTNTEWISEKSLNNLIKPIFDELFELGRNSNNELCDWIKKNYEKTYEDFF